MTIAAPAAPAAPAAASAAPAPSAPEIPKPGTGAPETPVKPETSPPGSPPAGDPGKAPADPNKPPETPAPDPEKPYQIKVNGQPMNVSLEQLQKLAQKGVGAETKFEEAHKMRQSAEQFLRLLKENPIAVLTNPKIGLDLKKIAQDFLLKEIEKEQLTPDQRELHDTKEKLREAEEEKRLRAQQEEQTQMEALVKEHHEILEKDITSTLEASGLPKTRDTVRRMAFYMAKALERKVVLKAADVVDLVRADYHRDVTSLFSALEGDQITKLLGDPVIKKILEAEMKRVNGAPPAPPAAPALPDAPAPAGALMDKDTWRADMEKRFGK